VCFLAVLCPLISGLADIRTGPTVATTSSSGSGGGSTTDGTALTNLSGASVVYYTNANFVRPDFALPYSLLQTNAGFAFLTPTNVDSTKLTVQTCVVLVHNPTGSMFPFTAPANVAFQGTWNATNDTAVTFFVYGGAISNAISLPLR